MKTVPVFVLKGKELLVEKAVAGSNSLLLLRIMNLETGALEKLFIEYDEAFRLGKTICNITQGSISVDVIREMAKEESK